MSLSSYVFIALTQIGLSKEEQLDFQAMHQFMNDLIVAIHDHGARAIRIFPPASQVVLFFFDRIANEVVCNFSYFIVSCP